MFVRLHQLVHGGLRAAVLVKLLLAGRAPGRRPDLVYSRNANDANELCPSNDDEYVHTNSPDSKE